jgi:hypothetical protein
MSEETCGRYSSPQCVVGDVEEVGIAEDFSTRVRDQSVDVARELGGMFFKTTADPDTMVLCQYLICVQTAVRTFGRYIPDWLH